MQVTGLSDDKSPIPNPQSPIHKWASRQQLDVTGWRANRHVQTVWNKFALRGERIASASVVYVPLVDGTGQLRLWLHRGEQDAALVCLFHGLEGSAHAPYLMAAARRALGRGWNVARVDTINCGGTHRLARRFYHAGMTETIESVIGWSRRAGFQSVYLVGFSLGGNQVLRYLGLQADGVSSEVLAAAAISTPIDLALSCRSIDSRQNWVYRHHFLDSMYRTLRKKQKSHPELLRARRVARVSTFREFDDRYTAPLCGFQSAEDYWFRASSKGVLNRIRRPTLILHAEDDPFVPVEQFKQVGWHDNRFLVPLFTQKGGHLGFHGPGRDVHWAADRIMEFFEKVAQKDEG